MNVKFKNLLRLLFLIVLLAIILFFVFDKIKKQQKEAQKSTYSFYTEYQKKGYPITVQEVQKKKIHFYKKLTLIKQSNSNYIAWVDKEFKKNLKPGEKIFLRNSLGKQVAHGYISSISQKINYNVGLYQVKVKITEAIPEKSKFTNVKIETKTKNTIAINNKFVTCDENSCFVFIAKNNTIHKREVKTGLFDENLIEIVSGLKEKDLIVSSDTRYLKDNLKIKIFKPIQEK